MFWNLCAAFGAVRAFLDVRSCYESPSNVRTKYTAEMASSPCESILNFPQSRPMRIVCCVLGFTFWLFVFSTRYLKLQSQSRHVARTYRMDSDSVEKDWGHSLQRCGTDSPPFLFCLSLLESKRFQVKWHGIGAEFTARGQHDLPIFHFLSQIFLSLLYLSDDSGSPDSPPCSLICKLLPGSELYYPWYCHYHHSLFEPGLWYPNLPHHIHYLLNLLIKICFQLVFLVPASIWFVHNDCH